VALETASTISVAVLPEKVARNGGGSSATVEKEGQPVDGAVQIPKGGLDLERHIARLERAYIVAALEACDGTGTRAAEMLRMNYRSFRHYAKKYDIHKT